MNGHNEAFARFIAFTSPFAFWATISLLGACIWFVQ